MSIFGGAIAESTPHLYLSALPLWPQNSQIWRAYGHRCQDIVRLEEGGIDRLPSLQRVLEGHGSSVTVVAFSPDGTGIVSGSNDTTLRIWDSDTGLVVAGPFEGHTDYVTSVAFSLDGTRIVSGSRDRTVRIWDAETGLDLVGPLKGHAGVIQMVGFSPNGKLVLSVDWSGGMVGSGMFRQG